MPSNLIDELLKVTSSTQAAPNSSTENTPATEALRTLTTQIDSLRGLYQTQVSQTSENIAAVVQNTRSRSAELASSAADIAKTAGSVFGGGLTFLPVISGLAKLFGFGGGPENLPDLPKFSLPSAIDLAGGVSNSGSSSVGEVTYGQNGLPRSVSAAGSGSTSINVNVQAIDSRSFLDHSDDIARAVREAMLSSHPLNDVIAEM